MPKIIEEMFCFIATEENGDEGIPAFGGNGMFYPMVGADLERVEQLKPIAAQIAKVSNKKIRVVKFTSKEELGSV